MLGMNFYNHMIEKYVVIFGQLFSDLQITRSDASNNAVQTFQVPISYGPREKFLARVESDPTLNRPYSELLPRISFQMMGVDYDGARKLMTTHTYQQHLMVENRNTYLRAYMPVPYNIGIKMSIMAKQAEDAHKIFEQIVPYFTPDWTVKIVPLEEMPNYELNIPIILSNASYDDQYDADFKTRRIIIWELSFVMKAYLFGPVDTSRLIKIATVNLYTDIPSLENPETSPAESVVVQPGLTANGQPTSDINQTIPYAQIDESSNYGYIVTIEPGSE